MAITEASLDRTGREAHDAAKRYLALASTQLTNACNSANELAAAQYVRNAALQYEHAALHFKLLADNLNAFAGAHE